MKYFFPLVLMVSISLFSKAQTLTITDKESQEPLDMVTLLSKTPEVYTTTNSKGQANISAFKKSEQIEIRTIGYKTVLYSFEDLAGLEFQLSLETSNLNLDEIVLSASRWHQASKDLPVKIKTITPKEVALQNPQTAADLLNISGKVFIQKSQQGGGSPIIRGFATNRLLYTVDGVRMNNAIFRSGNIQNVISLDAFAIENTEVLFGPRSVVYGSDAIGGVMSFQTLSPAFSLDDEMLVSGKANTRVSTANNERTGHFDVNIGGKKWAFITSLSSSDFDHLKQGKNGPDDYIKNYYVGRIDTLDKIIAPEDSLLQIPSEYEQLNIMQKVHFKPNETWDFNYGFHHSETSPYGRYDRHNRVQNNLPRYAEWSYGPQVWKMHNLNIAYTKKTKWFDHATMRLAYQRFEESRISRDLYSDTRTIKSEEVDAYSANFDLLKALNNKNSLFYGFEYVFNDVFSKGETLDMNTAVYSDAESRYPKAQWSSLAAYVNHAYKASELLTFQSGLRFNQYQLDATFDTTYYPFPFTTANLKKAALTGSIGATYRPSESWLLSSNFGTAFRSPNVDDMGKLFDSGNGIVVVPNPELKAEYAYNGDIGAAKVFGDVLKLDVSAYFTFLDNAMVRRDFTLNGQDSLVYDGTLSQVQAVQNAAKAKVFGIQAGLELKLPKGFKFSSDFNFQKGEEELANGNISPTRHATPAFGTTRLNYKAQKISLQINVQYQAERSSEDMPAEEQSKTEIYALDGNGLAYAPSWYTLNFKGMYQVTSYLSITAGVENITSQRYRPYSSGISGAGRNFVISIKAIF